MIYKAGFEWFVSFAIMTEKRDHLYTQKIYPSVNTNDLLEFRIPPNPKGQLDLNPHNSTARFNDEGVPVSPGGSA